MPITLLDIILLGVMLISALLAMIRGFMREVLSIAAWVIAAGVTLYSYSKLLPFAKSYFNNDIVAAAVVIGGTFLGTLIIVSIITVRFSDMVLDSRVGALDRTLGFLFGLAPRAGHRGRGLPVLRLAGAGTQPARMGSQRQIAGGAAGDRRLADVDVAGRPGKHHLEAVEEAQARGRRAGADEPTPWSALGPRRPAGTASGGRRAGRPHRHEQSDPQWCHALAWRKQPE